jgi:hypothetical protein
MPPMSDDLKLVIAAYISKWRSMSRFYASISLLLSGTLIIASALVAAKLGTKSTGFEVATSILSVYVAAGTGLVGWLKPREKWKGFMTDHENAQDLLMRIENSDASDLKQVEEFRVEFQRILATHREKNVF